MKYKENSIEAVVRCVIYAAVADRKLSEAELKSFVLLPLKQLNKDLGGSDFDVNFGAIIVDVKEASNPYTKLKGLEAKKQYIDLISSTITDRKLQETTLHFAINTASADRLVITEDYVIQRFKRNWSISA